MQKPFLLFLLLSVLLLPAAELAVYPAQGQSRNSYAIEIPGSSWANTSISILLVTPLNQSWWDPAFANSTLRAIGQWNDAIQAFSADYPSYSYLSSVKFMPTVSNQTAGGYDVYLSWVRFPPANAGSEIGLTATSDRDNVIVNCSISLATHTAHGDALSQVDEQNVALHELGHSLGIGHTNETSDVMFPDYTLLSAPKSLSTLDVYGVATVFGWLEHPTTFFPVTSWLNDTPVSLPSNIPYKGLPVSSPNAVPQTLANNPIYENFILVLEIIIHPEILAIILLFVGVFVVLGLFSRRKNKPSKAGS